MMPQQAPQATPAPIHDITDPLWFLPYPVWMIVVAAVALLALLGLIIWLIARKRPARPLTARQRALASLSDLRQHVGEEDSYAFGVKISDALRSYIRDQHGVDAVTRTSIEFLESLQQNSVFSDNEKAALAEFLESADLLKYARQTAGTEEINALLEIAERLVRGEGPANTPVKS